MTSNYGSPVRALILPHDSGMVRKYPNDTKKINISRTPDQDFRCFNPCEVILSHIPMDTRSSDPYVSSLSEKSVPHRYPCEISLTNTG